MENELSYYRHSNNFWVQKHVYDQMNGTARAKQEREEMERRNAQAEAKIKSWHIIHEKMEIKRAHCQPTPRTDGPTLLYRYFCADKLLYIGITYSKDTRHKAHSKHSPWFDDHDRVEYVEFKQRSIAEEAEKNAIQKEKPRWNIIHNANRIKE
jgi:predicted GIY-YIG superfamily endonuclease